MSPCTVFASMYIFCPVPTIPQLLPTLVLLLADAVRAAGGGSPDSPGGAPWAGGTAGEGAGGCQGGERHCRLHVFASGSAFVLKGEMPLWQHGVQPALGAIPAWPSSFRLQVHMHMCGLLKLAAASAHRGLSSSRASLSRVPKGSVQGMAAAFGRLTASRPAVSTHAHIYNMRAVLRRCLQAQLPHPTPPRSLASAIKSWASLGRSPPTSATSPGSLGPEGHPPRAPGSRSNSLPGAPRALVVEGRRGVPLKWLRKQEA